MNPEDSARYIAKQGKVTKYIFLQGEKYKEIPA